MLGTGRGDLHEEVRTQTARGQGPGQYGKGTAATGGPAAAAQGPAAGDSSVGRTTVRWQEDKGREENGERDKGWGREVRVRGIGKGRERHGEKAKETGMKGMVRE